MMDEHYPGGKAGVGLSRMFTVEISWRCHGVSVAGKRSLGSSCHLANTYAPAPAEGGPKLRQLCKASALLPTIVGIGPGQEASGCSDGADSCTLVAACSFVVS